MNGWMTIWMTVAWYQCIQSEFLVGLNQMVDGFVLVNWCIVGLNDSPLMACAISELEEHGLADSFSRWAMGAPWSVCMDGCVGPLMLMTQGHSYMLWEALRLCCHAFVHLSTVFCITGSRLCSDDNRAQMRTWTHYDILVMASNRKDWRSGHSGACCGKADRSAVCHRSVTSWDARCGGCGTTWSDSGWYSDDGSDCEH